MLLYRNSANWTNELEGVSKKIANYTTVKLFAKIPVLKASHLYCGIRGGIAFNDIILLRRKMDTLWRATNGRTQVRIKAHKGGMRDR